MTRRASGGPKERRSLRAITRALRLNDRSAIAIALSTLRRRYRGIGLGGVEECEFVPDSRVVKTPDGTRVVHLQQTWRGIPLFRAARTVLISSAGRVRSIAGEGFRVPTGSPLAPEIDVGTAFRSAVTTLLEQYAEQLRLHEVDTQAVRGYEPIVVAAFDDVARTIVVDRGPFVDAIPVHLAFHRVRRRVHLAWKLSLTFASGVDSWTVLVAAAGRHRGTVITVIDRAFRATEALIYRCAPVDGDRESVTFPIPSDRYPQLLKPVPTGFPGAWVESDATSGNNAIASEGAPLISVPSAGGRRFAPADPFGRDQAILNLFFACNLLHDFFLVLGFDEARRNFQDKNLPGVGLGRDRVQAHVRLTQISGGVTMTRDADGVSSFLTTGTDPAGRFYALDSDVVFHEYTHGVTHRIIGGTSSDVLLAPQSAGMSEGWSDYFALSLRNALMGGAERTTFAAWIGDTVPLRGHPYDKDYPSQATYGKIGKPGFRAAHTIGEIWASALLDMQRRLVQKYAARGHAIGWQMVFDSLMGLPANPNFVQGRQAMLSALTGLFDTHLIASAEREGAELCLWEAFARHGIGRIASSLGNGLAGIRQDFTA